MSLEELVIMASERSQSFKEKWEYWISRRKKVPDFDWLMTNLENALGEYYVKEAARAHIKAIKGK